MLANGLIHFVHSELLKLLPHHLCELPNVVPARVQRITQLLVGGCRLEVDVFHQVITRLSEVFRTQPVLNQLGNFMQCDTNGHVGILRNYRANPYLKDLSAASNVGIGEELEHTAWKRLDVSIVSVVHSASLANSVVEM